MANVTIAVAPSLRRFVSGQKELAAEADNVDHALSIFVDHAQELREHLYDETQQLRRFVRIFVDGKPVNMSAHSKDPLQPGAKINVMLALAGG